MVRINKKYTDFINESLIARPKFEESTSRVIISRGDKEFIIKRREELKESIEAMVEFFPGYFSDMCKKRDANPEKDYEEMQKLLDKKGWNFESIKNIFSELCNKLVGQDFKEWQNQGPLDRINGHCDVYLYFTAKNLRLNPDIIPLGGEGWADYREPEELFIRYKYGYHQTKYGQMMMQQMKISQEEFKRVAVTQLVEYIKDNWESYLTRYLPSKGIEFQEAKIILREIEFGDFSTEDEVEIIISVGDLREMILNRCSDKTKISLSEEDLCAVFADIISGFNLYTYHAAGEFVISLQED